MWKVLVRWLRTDRGRVTLFSLWVVIFMARCAYDAATGSIVLAVVWGVLALAYVGALVGLVRELRARVRDSSRA
jgi:hypothetical protein